MEQYLREIMSVNENGLYLCELPTGFGKTYTSVKLIAEWVCNHASDRKIIFLTTLNKNLPEEELRLPQRKLLLGELCEPLVWLKNEDVIPQVSFYQDGMEIYGFEDSDAHNDSTDINFIKVYDTPEKLLIYLAQRCKVVGISATAEIPTVVGNYDLNYLSECLGEKFHRTPKEVTERIKNTLEKTYQAYYDGRIKINTEIFSQDYEGKEFVDICREITGETEYADICANLISARSVGRYQSVRYCNAFRAMIAFCCHTSIKSMLYLGMALPKTNNPDFDIDLLRKLMSLAESLSGLDKRGDHFVVLTGDDFEKQKDKLIQRLADGEKLFVMSSYSTLGAGQNLQYPVNDTKGYIFLSEPLDPNDKRFFTKDFDALYLGDTTNLTTNTYSGKPMEETALMEMLFQIEELYHNGEFNFSEKDKMINLAFSTYSGGRESGNLLYQTSSVKMQATKYVIQAVGRMCRTFIKNPEIYIFAEEKLLDKISVGEMKRRVLPPEMKCITQMREQLGTVYTAEENRILNNAERISTVGMQTIRSLLSSSWTEHSMSVWRNMRETVLRFPTASAEDRNNNQDIMKLYITSSEKQNAYLYSQYSDFSNVTLDFTNDEIGFRNSPRAKRKGNTDEVAVYHMNEQESGLRTALRYRCMKEYFQSQGYAVGFAKQEYLLSPVMFHNIYKGALGEVCGEFILRRERGLRLRRIEDAERFEFFDFELGDGVYIDFKNWKINYRKDRKKTLNEIYRKLEQIGGKRVYIINLIGYEGEEPTVTHDSRIIEIPGLIDENGKVINKHLDWIKEDYDHFGENDYVSTTEREELINAYELLSSTLFRRGCEIECIIGDGLENYTAIGKTKEFTRPDTDKLYDALFQTQPNVTVRKSVLFGYLDEFAEVNEEYRQCAFELKEKLQDADELLTKGQIHKMMNLHSNGYKVLNRWLHSEHNLWIYSEFKSADSGMEMANLTRIQYYPDKWDDDSFYYFACPIKSRTVRHSLFSARRSPRPSCCKNTVSDSVGRKKRMVFTSGISTPSL